MEEGPYNFGSKTIAFNNDTNIWSYPAVVAEWLEQ